MPTSDEPSRHSLHDSVESWWSLSYPIPDDAFDEFGHLTAVHYPVAFEHAAVAFLQEAWGASLPDYVVAESTVTYRREVLPENSPARVSVATASVGTTSFGLLGVLADAQGTVCAHSSIRYVAWDRERRAKRPLDDGQRDALERRRPPSA